jgi:hypothetical protein
MFLIQSRSIRAPSHYITFLDATPNFIQCKQTPQQHGQQDGLDCRCQIDPRTKGVMADPKLSLDIPKWVSTR